MHGDKDALNPTSGDMPNLLTKQQSYKKAGRRQAGEQIAHILH